MSVSVSIAGNPCTTVTLVNSTTITAFTPAGTLGAKDLTVTNGDGQQSTLTASYTYENAPSLSNIVPSSGQLASGLAFTLNGTGFISGAGLGVTFGGVAATSVTWVSSTQVTGLTPAHIAATVNVILQNPDGQVSNSVNFTYEAAPVLSSCSPNAGALSGGTACTLNGSGFLAGATVTFAGVSATSIVVVSPTQITCVTPAGSGSANIVVQNTDGQSSTLVGGFLFEAAPTVSLVTPSTGSIVGGTNVTVTGTGFVAGATCTFDSNPAVNTVFLSSTSLTCTDTAHPAGLVTVSVQNPDGQSGTMAAAFTYNTVPLPPPTLASITPSTSTTLGNIAFNITGSNFIDNATISFGGVLATGVSFISSTQLSGVVPPALVAGPVLVTVENIDAQVSNALTFTYVAVPPVIASVSPTFGSTLGRDTVIITGTGFQAGVTVLFGSTPASVTFDSSTQLTVVTPSGTSIVDVRVTNPDAQFSVLHSAYTYIVLPPPENDRAVLEVDNTLGWRGYGKQPQASVYDSGQVVIHTAPNVLEKLVEGAQQSATTLRASATASKVGNLGNAISGTNQNSESIGNLGVPITAVSYSGFTLVVSCVNNFSEGQNILLDNCTRNKTLNRRNVTVVTQTATQFTAIVLSLSITNGSETGTCTATNQTRGAGLSSTPSN
jgi:hypothetical protein